MRRFKLINGKGSEFDLMRKDAFLHAPAGLGFAHNAEVARLGGSFALVKSEDTQPAPTAEIIFAGYEQWEELRRFLAVGGIVLAYKPLTEWRYLDVIVDLEKGEIEQPAMRLVCSVSFTGTSLWYEKTTAYKSVPGEALTYPRRYAYTYKDAETGEILLHNGPLASYPRITVMGPATDPVWTLYQHGEEKASGRVLGALPAGHKLVIDCHPATMSIRELTVQDEPVADRYAASDFDTARFFALPPGDCTLFFSQAGFGPVDGWVEVRRRV